MENKRTKITKIPDIGKPGDLGTYMWKMPNGKILANTEGDVLNVQCRFGDIKALANLQKAAKWLGFPDGTPVWSTQLRCTQEEWEEQMWEWKESGMMT